MSKHKSPPLNPDNLSGGPWPSSTPDTPAAPCAAAPAPLPEEVKAAKKHLGWMASCTHLYKTADAINVLLLHITAQARRLAEVEGNLNTVVQTLGCHPAFIIQEIERLQDIASRTPNADEHRQLRIRAEAAESALVAVTAERDAMAEELCEAQAAAHCANGAVKDLSEQMKAEEHAVRTLTADRDRLREALGWCVQLIDSVCGVSPRDREAFDAVCAALRPGSGEEG